MKTSFNHRKLRKRSRGGQALVELAICLPVFFLITMGTIETCRMIYLRQSLKIAAYETARLAITPGVTLDDLQTQCDVIMQGRNLHGYTTYYSGDPADLQYEDLFTVRIEIPAEECALIGTWFYHNQVFNESVTIMAEY